MPFCTKCGMRIQSGRLCSVCNRDEQLGDGWHDIETDGGVSTRQILDAIDRYQQRVINDHDPGAEHWQRHVDQMRLALIERGREVRGEVPRRA